MSIEALIKEIANRPKETILSEQEGSNIKEQIVKEHIHPFKEAWSLHIYESRYLVDGVEYVLYKCIGQDTPSEVMRVE